MAIRRATPGQMIRISANDFNTMAAAADDFLQRQGPGTSRAPTIYGTESILMLNDSDTDYDRFDIMGITGPVIAPATSQQGFLDRLAVRGDTATAEHLGKFAVLLEPVAAGAMGRVCIEGVTAARLWVTAESDGFADISTENVGKLTTSASGSARVLWKETGTTTSEATMKWGIVRLGAGVATPDDFWALITGSIVDYSLTKDGVTQVATWKYGWYEAVPYYAGGRVKWVQIANARSGTTASNYAANGLEFPNIDALYNWSTGASSTIGGFGTSYDELKTATSQFYVRPVAPSSIVRMRMTKTSTGEMQAVFSSPNNLGGGCI